jgi:hypothetical protein
MVPSIAIMPREGRLALAAFGRVRKVHESVLSLSAGRRSFAVKRILEAALVILLGISLFSEWLPSRNFQILIAVSLTLFVV